MNQILRTCKKAWVRYRYSIEPEGIWCSGFGQGVLTLLYVGVPVGAVVGVCLYGETGLSLAKEGWQAETQQYGLRLCVLVAVAGALAVAFFFAVGRMVERHLQSIGSRLLQWAYFPLGFLYYALLVCAAVAGVAHFGNIVDTAVEEGYSRRVHVDNTFGAYWMLLAFCAFVAWLAFRASGLNRERLRFAAGAEMASYQREFLSACLRATRFIVLYELCRRLWWRKLLPALMRAWERLRE